MRLNLSPVWRMGNSMGVFLRRRMGFTTEGEPGVLRNLHIQIRALAERSGGILSDIRIRIREINLLNFCYRAIRSGEHGSVHLKSIIIMDGEISG